MVSGYGLVVMGYGLGVIGYELLVIDKCVIGDGRPVKRVRD